MTKDERREKEILQMMRWQDSPIEYLHDVFGLIPQPIKPEYAIFLQYGMVLKWAEWQAFVKTIRASWFQPFIKGKHITWQQYVILLCITKAMRHEAPMKISVVAGRGVGKSNIFAFIDLWFLNCFPNSVIPCTAVTADQLDEALWKELALWLSKMPEALRAKFDLSSDHIRVKESPETWFSRARTASKDRPEALSGVHSDHILALIDEASAVHEKVFEMGQGILTSDIALLVMISNGTTNEGFFYRSHHENAGAYQCLSFNSEESPIVNRKYVQSVIDDYCKNIPPELYDTVTEYRVNVLGLFPKIGVMDDKGYLPLVGEKDIKYYTGSIEFVGRRIMGVDCAGDGDDKSVWVIRDRSKAIVIAEEQVSSPTTIAQKTITLAEQYDIPLADYADIVVDGFGSAGMKVGQEIALMTKGLGKVTIVNTGDKCEDDFEQEEYLNQRAEAYWKSRLWLQSDGLLKPHGGLEKDLSNIRYRHSGKKIQIEPKLDMKKRGNRSPDYSDAFSMTFLRRMTVYMNVQQQALIARQSGGFDPHDPLGD